MAKQQNFQVKDKFQKPPTNSQLIEEQAHHIQQLYNILGDINSRLICLSIAKTTPKVLATFMLDQEAQNKFMDELNLELEVDKIIKEKNELSEETKSTISANSNL